MHTFLHNVIFLYELLQIRDFFYTFARDKNYLTIKRQELYF